MLGPDHTIPANAVGKIFSSRMLKNSASSVLASLRGATYRSVRLGTSLAAALLDGLFEHPACNSGGITIREITTAYFAEPNFSVA